MNAKLPIDTNLDAESGLTATLARQRAAFLRDGPPSLADRRRDLMTLKDAILARQGSSSPR